MQKFRKPASQKGFTLIEIAIVMVIIGLLLGGVLKGQEMIKNAKAHNVSNQMNAVKAAILAFQDRYRALPGDYIEARATANIPGVIGGGNGNSRVGDAATATSGAAVNEIVYVWNHLGASGFITGSYDGQNTGVDLTTWTCPATTCLQNAFNGSVVFAFSNQQQTPAVATKSSNQLWTGTSLPVDLLAEIDRKNDDGLAQLGSYQLGDAFSGTGAAVSQCNLNNDYDIDGAGQDCGAVILF